MPCGISHAITARSSREKKKLSGDFLRSQVVRNKRKNHADAANKRKEKPGSQTIYSPCFLLRFARVFVCKSILISREKGKRKTKE